MCSARPSVTSAARVQRISVTSHWERQPPAPITELVPPTTPSPHATPQRRGTPPLSRARWQPGEREITGLLSGLGADRWPAPIGEGPRGTKVRRAKPSAPGRDDGDPFFGHTTGRNSEAADRQRRARPAHHVPPMGWPGRATHTGRLPPSSASARAGAETMHLHRYANGSPRKHFISSSSL